MGTEEQIVWDIIETAKQGLSSDDSRLDERTVRSFLHTYRASLINKYSMEGLLISDECFQYLGALEFDYLKPKQFTRQLPKIIRMQNYGLMFSKNGENIPVMESEQFQLGLKNIINGKHPKAMFLAEKATIFIGRRAQTTCGQTLDLNTMIDDFENELIDTSGTKITIDVWAVLHNPDDAPGYDFTQDPFPCNSELVEDIKTKIYQKEFNIWVNTRTDKVTDGDNSQGNKEPV